jgi:sigma-E factor negative regulatory protein RseB
MDKLLVLLILCGAVTARAAAPSPSTPELSPVPEVTTQIEQREAALKTTDVDGILTQVRSSLNSLNFEASFVLFRGNFAEPYNWMHGIYEGQEIEYMRSQNGVNIEIVRKGDLVGYFEAESKPHSVNSRSIEGVLPALFFDDSIVLGDYYSIAVGGKSRIVDRTAQLIRIIAKDNYRFNYWLWLDIKTSLILKSALISKQGEVLEQFQITHLNVLDKAPKLAKQLSETPLPTPIKQQSNNNTKSRWKVTWLPEGFKVVSTNQHKLSLTGEFTDYLLVTDGLVELSIYIQKPLSNKIKGGHLRSGSNVVAVHHGNGFDVSVIGKVPAITAERIAQSVKAG